MILRHEDGSPLERDTPEWRRAHRACVSASDSRAIMADDGTRARRELIERIVLDREGIDRHEDEQPDPWRDAHEASLRSALAAYRRAIGPIEPAPLCCAQGSTWLLAAAHGVTASGMVLFRCRATLRSYSIRSGRVERAWRARAQLTAFVCEVGRVDVVDFLDGQGRIQDRLNVHRIYADKPWLEAAVFPRLVALWGSVAERLRERGSVPRATTGNPI